MSQDSVAKQDKQKQAPLLLEDEALRDGLQIESQIFTINQKIEFFNMLKKAGVKRIQVGSFVHPKIVPQMADSDELIKVLGSQADTVISALILNSKGLERAMACAVPHVSMSVSISDTHSRKNARRPATEALISMVELIKSARSQGLEVRAGLQSAFGCVYEGTISESAVLAAAEKMTLAGVNEINLADSSGMANPYSIKSLVKQVTQEFPEVRISLHLHDTRGLGLANMFSGYEAGVRVFDVCTGGLGGCPFIKGAAGNVPTEDAVNMFESMGIDTGIEPNTIIEAVAFLEKILNRHLPGRMKRVLSFEQSCDTQ
ncbi:MAG: hydroxymethylglutaryl-CoA lyase [Desulfobacterales bacterium]|nr:hydroxymethylglutaryl-CoA lyase [Desulfobacterales bacterium]